MAKAKIRSRGGSSRAGSAQGRSGHRARIATTALSSEKVNDALSTRSASASAPVRPASQFGSSVRSGLLSTGMVALGCWGMMIFFFFFYPDANRVLFGCMAALMALMWSYSFGNRLRRRLRQPSS